MFVRVKTRGGRRYAYLVESVWVPEARTPRQRVVKYLGPADEVRPEDIPARMRSAPAVAKWLEANAQETQRAYAEEIAKTRETLRAALLEPSQQDARRAASRGVARFGAWTFLDEVVTPLLHRIGDDWCDGNVSAVDERLVSHGLTTLIHDLLEETRAAAPRRRPALTALLANPEGELHALPLHVLACRLVADGHRPILVPGGVPRRDLAARARDLAPPLVLVSATLEASAKESLRMAEAVLEKSPEATVALGGQAWQGKRQPRNLDARIRLHREGPVAPFLDGLVQECLGRSKAVNASGA